MLKKSFILGILLSMTSCATIFNSKTQKIHVYSYQKAKVKINDSIYELPAKIKVVRSKNDLPAVLIGDSITKNFILKPSVNPNFAIGNLAFVQFAPVGYAIDLFSAKRYYYGKNIVINFDDSITEIKTPVSQSVQKFKDYFTKKHETKKGQINATISFPLVNGLYFKPQGQSFKYNAGPWGVSGGFEYYYETNKFLSVNASAVRDVITLAHGYYEDYNQSERMTAVAFGFTNNYKVKRFIFGYGVSYSKNTWYSFNERHEKFLTSFPKDIWKSNKTLGLIANSYFQFGREFCVGIIYKPSLYRLNNSSGFQYEHVVSLDFQWKVRIWE